MGKKYIVINGVIALCLVASLLLNVRYLYRNIENHRQGTQDEITVTNQKTAEKKVAEGKDVTLFDAILSISWGPGTPMEGWFIEHLKDKFGIEVQQADVSPGMFEGCEKGVELCWLDSYVSYYEAVKAGKLRNLEDEIKKNPKVYQKYQKAIKKMKADTYKHTGKKGVFGIPAQLSSFDDVWKEGNCVVVPVNAPHPQLALELLTYSASDEGIMDIAFGPKGQMWKKENGKYVLLRDWQKISSGNMARKVVKTKNGMEDYSTAVCKLQLVGNESLGRELLAK